MKFNISIDTAVLLTMNDTVIGVIVNPTLDLITEIVRNHNVCSCLSLLTDLSNEEWNGLDIFDIEYELSDEDNSYKQIVCLSTIPLHIGNMPNGFNSWQNTHFEIASEIEYQLNNQFSILDEGSKLYKHRDSYGRNGLYEFGKELADKFEKEHNGTDWGNEYVDYFESINIFTKKELL